jgi:hypothetical protein
MSLWLAMPMLSQLFFLALKLKSSLYLKDSKALDSYLEAMARNTLIRIKAWRLHFKINTSQLAACNLIQANG